MTVRNLKAKLFAVAGALVATGTFFGLASHAPAATAATPEPTPVVSNFTPPAVVPRAHTRTRAS